MKLQNLKHRDRLLSDLVDIARAHSDLRFWNVQVTFWDGDRLLHTVLGFEGALDVVVNDLYFDENDNWAEANRLKGGTY